MTWQLPTWGSSYISGHKPLSTEKLRKQVFHDTLFFNFKKKHFRAVLTLTSSLHQQRDFTSLRTFNQHIHHLVVSEALHILLVDFNYKIALLQAAAPWAVHDLFHSLATPARTVCYSKPKAHRPFHYMHSYEFRLCCYWRCQRDRVIGVTMGSVGRDLSRAAGSCFLCAIYFPCFTTVACRGVVIFLPVHNDRLFVQNCHGCNEACVGIIRIEGQGVASAQFEVHAGTDGDGLEDFHNLSMSVSQHTCIVHADYDVPCRGHRYTKHIVLCMWGLEPVSWSTASTGTTHR